MTTDLTVLPFLLADDGATDPAEAAVEIADVITAMPGHAPLAATLHRLNRKAGSSGATWLVMLRVPKTVDPDPGSAIMMRVEDAVTAELGRQVTAVEMPHGADPDAASAAALDTYDTARGWLPLAHTPN